MSIDAWLPKGFNIGPRCSLREVIEDGPDWQIYATSTGARALLATPPLASRWISADLLASGAFEAIEFGEASFFVVQSERQHQLVSLPNSPSPNSVVEALAFAKSLQLTRARVPDAPLQDSIYVERHSVLLPCYSLTSAVSDDVVLGAYLSGGVQVSCRSSRRLQSILSWLPEAQLIAIVEAAGLAHEGATSAETGAELAPNQRPLFELPGRPALESFFRDHVIDIVDHRERYRAMGIESPSAIILHGPPGCGKTFAVEKLVEHLGWPSYHIGSGTVGSPFIHETGRKIGEVFAKAIDHAPSVVVIDEMESFLAERARGADTGHHRVEEVAEFLRRIPEAVEAGILVIGMTNMIEMIDPAILRRGRFDHIVEVAMPTKEEVGALLDKLMARLPVAEDIRIERLAERLASRPMSDVTFVIREAGRLAAKAGRNRLDQETLEAALSVTPVRDAHLTPHKRIGFA